MNARLLCYGGVKVAGQRVRAAAAQLVGDAVRQFDLRTRFNETDSVQRRQRGANGGEPRFARVIEVAEREVAFGHSEQLTVQYSMGFEPLKQAW